MQDTGEFEAYSVVPRKEKPNCFQCSFINLLFSFVCKDIDSDRPMMQVGPYVFAGEYEGEKSCKMKKYQLVPAVFASCEDTYSCLCPFLVPKSHF